MDGSSWKATGGSRSRSRCSPHRPLGVQPAVEGHQIRVLLPNRPDVNVEARVLEPAVHARGIRTGFAFEFVPWDLPVAHLAPAHPAESLGEFTHRQLIACQLHDASLPVPRPLACERHEFANVID